MKKFIAIILLLSMTLPLVACASSSAEMSSKITCDEIVEAYLDAGYVCQYHTHEENVYDENGAREYCHMAFEDPTESDRDYIYISRYHTPREARAVKRERTYNPAIWIIAVMYGEWRWFKSRSYDDIQYETFDRDALKPMRKVIFNHISD